MKVAALALLLTACTAQHHRSVIRPNYAYVETSRGTYAVYVRNPKALEEAKKELGCGICGVDISGSVYIVTTTKGN